MATFGQDPRLATIASFVESFRQAKALQFQKALLTRREDRFDIQLQENRRHRQRQLSLRESDPRRALADIELETVKDATPEQRRSLFTRGTTVNMPLFSPGQIRGTDKTQGIQDVIAEEIAKITVTRSDLFGLGKGTDTIKQSALDLARQNAGTRTGRKFFREGQAEQFDFEFESQINAKFYSNPKRTTEITQDVSAGVFDGGEAAPPINPPPKDRAYIGFTVLQDGTNIKWRWDGNKWQRAQ